MRAQAGEHKNTCSDNGTDAERGQLEDSKSPLQAVFACLPGLFHQHSQWLTSQQICHSC